MPRTMYAHLAGTNTQDQSPKSNPLIQIKFTLDIIPPSTNALWRSVNGRTVLSKEGRAWYKTAPWEFRIAAQEQNQGPLKPISDPLSVSIIVQFKDRRKRDLDNLAKPILDTLVKSNLIKDDHLVHELHMKKLIGTWPKVDIAITPLTRSER